MNLIFKTSLLMKKLNPVFSKSSILHPVLFSIYPVIFLYSNNIHVLPFRGVIIPLLAIPIFSFSLWLILRFVLKNGKKAGLIVSLLIIMFFLFGRIFNYITEFFPDENSTTQTSLFVIFFILLGAGIFYFVKTKRKLDRLTLLSNVISITLIVIVLANIGIYKLDSYSYEEDISKSENFLVSSLDKNKLPDIYYILLDGYANSIILKKYLEYDNQSPIDKWIFT